MYYAVLPLVACLLLPSELLAQTPTFDPIAKVHRVSERWVQFSLGHAADVTGDGTSDILFAPYILQTGLFQLGTVVLNGAADSDANIAGPQVTHPGPASGHRAIGMTSEDFRGNGVKDIVILSSRGRLIRMRAPASGIGLNPGVGFADYFAQDASWQPDLSLNLPPYQALNAGGSIHTVGILFTDDVNGDSNLDLVASLNFTLKVNSASYLEAYNSGIYTFLGDGQGGFQAPIVFETWDWQNQQAFWNRPHGQILDYEWLDLTPATINDPKTLIVMSENHNMFGFSTEITQLRWNSSLQNFELVPNTNPLQVAPFGDRVSGLALGNLDNDSQGTVDWVISFNGLNGNIQQGGFIHYPGDTQGQPIGWTQSTSAIALPPPLSPSAHYEIHAPQVRDLDGDNTADLLYLRTNGFTTNSEIVFVSGPVPFASLSGAQIISTGGRHGNGPPPPQGYFGANRPRNHDVQLVDNDRNGLPSITVFGLRGPYGYFGADFVSVIRNLADRPNAPLFRRYSEGGTSVSGYRAGIGLGGDPSPGGIVQVRQQGGVPGLSSLHASDFRYEWTYLGLNLGMIPGSGPVSHLMNTTGTPGNVRAELSFTIPNHPSYLGAEFYFQWLNFDPTGNAFSEKILPSDAARLRIGQ